MEDKKYFSDAELEAKLTNLRKEEPHLLCPSSKKIVRLCTNAKCLQNALRCSDMNCPSCGREVHPTCASSFSLEELTYLLNQRGNKIKDFVVKVLEIEDGLIDQLRKSQRKFIDKQSLGFQREKHRQIIKQIFEKKSMKNCLGRDVLELCEQLQQNKNEKVQKLLQEYSNESLRAAKDVGQMKEKVLNKLMIGKIKQIGKHYHQEKEAERLQVKRRQREREIQRQKIKTQIAVQKQRLKQKDEEIERIKLEEKRFQKRREEKKNLKFHSQPLAEDLDIYFDSKILNIKTELGRQQFKFIFDHLEEPTRMDLLFRASQHGFQASKFHRMCDDFNDTLVLIRTQFGKTIAGYSHYKWNQVKNKFVRDQKRRTFLLQLEAFEFLQPQSDDKLIYCNPATGPIFGYDDLFISDCCHQNYSWANFPYNYNTEDGFYKKRGPLSWEMFSGATKTSNFKVKQYEVYHVTSMQLKNLFKESKRTRFPDSSQSISDEENYQEKQFEEDERQQDDYAMDRKKENKKKKKKEKDQCCIY